MKRKYKIYPKKGEILILELEYFEFKDGSFVLHNERFGNSVPGGFLSFENIAAILPDPLRPYKSNLELDPTTFRVYLKNRPIDDALIIQADTCDSSKPPSLIFYVKAYINDPNDRNEQSTKLEAFPLRDIYIAVSEVIAIVPSLP